MSHKRADSQSSYYFVNQHHGIGGTIISSSTRDAGDESAVIETVPAGVNLDKFEPRILDIGDHQSVHSALSSVNAKTTTTSTKSSNKQGSSKRSDRSRSKQQQQQQQNRVPVFGYLTNLFYGGGSSKASSSKNDGGNRMDFSGQHKVDPKVFFAAERTFLAWMHAAVLLAGISVAISAYSETGSASDIYGIMVLPISIVFMIYAMVQYGDRAVKIKKRSPGPYEDRWGPVVLGTIFCFAIVAELLVELYEQANAA